MNEVKAVVLAAGKGTRMQSEQCNLPKVLREACGKPLLHYVLSALDFIPQENTILVVGYQREKVMDAFPGYPQPYRNPRWAPATPCSAPGRFWTVSTAQCSSATATCRCCAGRVYETF